jgi:hypothetical protein
MPKSESIVRTVRSCFALAAMAASLLAPPALAQQGLVRPDLQRDLTPEPSQCLDLDLENGISGTLRVNYMFYAPTSPALVVVTTDEDFEQLAHVLRCKADGTGLVRITGGGVDWKMRLTLDQTGVRMTGYCHSKGRRIYVTTDRQASGYWQ